MGFGRRVVRKSVRRATPRPVRKAIHPARTVRYAVTPRPVRQVSRAAYTVRHPVGAAENKVIGAALNAGTGHRRSRRSGNKGSGFWRWLLRGLGHADPPPAVPAKQPTWPRNTTPTTRLAAPTPPGAAPLRRPAPQPWPANRAFRGNPPPITRPSPRPEASGPHSAGEWELDVRRTSGLGDGSLIKWRSEDD
jgi:hypothetical protein